MRNRQQRIINAWRKLSPLGKLIALVNILIRAGAIPALVILAAAAYALATLPPLVVLAGVVVLWVAVRRPSPQPR